MLSAIYCILLYDLWLVTVICRGGTLMAVRVTRLHLEDEDDRPVVVSGY